MTMSLDIGLQARFDAIPVCDHDVNEAQKYINFLHGDADGWVAFFNKPLYGRKRTRCYQTSEITADMLRGVWAGRVNSYVSLNTMFIPRRRNQYTRQFRAIPIDLDYKHVDSLRHLSHEAIIELLGKDYFGRVIPQPNVIIHADNLQLIILIDPAPYRRTVKLWKAIQRRFVEVLKDLGADPACKDPARVMRLPGTWHRTGVKITAEYRHSYRYSLKELQDEYLPEIPPDWKERRQKRAATQRSKRVPANKVHTHRGVFGLRSLNLARMQDLKTICELRNWNMTGHREQILFLFRYWALLYYGNPLTVSEQVRRLSNQFTESYERLEDTDSAEMMWRSAQANAQGADLPKTNAGYSYSNDTLIQMLDITPDEQRHLSTIIGKEEKSRRRREKLRQVPREEYLAPARERRLKVWHLRQQGLSLRKIAAMVGCSLAEVHRLLKQVLMGTHSVQGCALDCVGGVALSQERQTNGAAAPSESGFVPKPCESADARLVHLMPAHANTPNTLNPTPDSGAYLALVLPQVIQIHRQDAGLRRQLEMCVRRLNLNPSALEFETMLSMMRCVEEKLWHPVMVMQAYLAASSQVA